MKFNILMLLLCFSINTNAQSENMIDEAWKGFSRPEIFDSGFTHKFSTLPLEGQMDVNPLAWSGDYWSAKKGGINYRWNAPIKTGYDLKSPSKEQAQSMRSEELATLAPSEKFDLFLGRYSYPLVKEVNTSASKLASDWAGICHGWAPATLFHKEPLAKVMTNPDGIKVPFGSADIKALLSYYYAFYQGSSNVSQMGLRCFFGSWLGAGRGCNEDLNAGAFHIVLSNKLGLQKEGFVMDIERWREVWNYPAIAYNTTILTDDLRPSKDAAKTAVKEMRLKTDVTYVEGAGPAWGSVFGTEDQKIAILQYQYRIELNQNGEIVGGTWESNKRPDFIWNLPRADVFSGLLTNLSQLLND